MGLLSGQYSRQPEEDSSNKEDSKPPKVCLISVMGGMLYSMCTQEQEGIPPMMFKALIGRGHPEFSTARQQVSNQNC